MTALSKPSPALARHLALLADAEARGVSSAVWMPVESGEKRCAAVGERQGLLVSGRVFHDDGYELTDAGRDALAKVGGR